MSLSPSLPGLYRVSAGEAGTVCLVRVRNPWGDKNEWKGQTSIIVLIIVVVIGIIIVIVVISIIIVIVVISIIIVIIIIIVMTVIIITISLIFIIIIIMFQVL